MAIHIKAKAHAAHTKIKHALRQKKPDNKVTQTFSRLAARFGLPFGIFLAIVIALLLTVVSMALYFISGTSKLDLSRPGYESARKQITHDSSNDQSFPSTGPIDAKVIKDFLARYDKETKNLDQYDKFDQNILDDTQIGLTDQQIAPSDGASQ